MTENEAIERLEQHKEWGFQCTNEAIDIAIQALEEIGQYRELEKKLNGISIEQVVKGFIEQVEKGTSEGYERGRILTNKEADDWNTYRANSAEWNKYLMARTELEELSGHTVDVAKLLHYFSETIFQGEKHEGFCILTNEDAKMWEDFNAIGTVEEFKALKEYKEKMEMQYLDDMDNPLEPIKLSSALQSEILKYNYRKEHKPQDINILDYTIMYALKYCLEEQLKGDTK